jgi:hypothetical protein
MLILGIYTTSEESSNISLENDTSYLGDTGFESSSISNITWVGSHPGSDVENSVQEIFLTRKSTDSFDDNNVFLVKNYLSYVSYSKETDLGLVLLLTEISNDKFLRYWLDLLFDIHNIETFNKDNIKQIISKSEPEFFNIDLNEDLKIQTEILTSYSIVYQDKEEFITEFFRFIRFNPWIILFLDKTIITVNQIDIYLSSEFPKEISKDNIEIIQSHLKDLESKISNLIYNAIHNCIVLYPSTKSTQFQYYFSLIVSYALSETIDEKITIYSENIKSFLELNTEFIVDQITTVVNEISDLEVLTNEEISKIIKLSEELYYNNFTDLARLCEGTAFEFSLRLEEFSEKAKFIEYFTSNAIKWGSEYTTGFVQMLGDILGSEPFEIELFSKILDKTEKILLKSGKGRLNLIDHKLKVGKKVEAIKDRLSLIDEIKNNEDQAIDTFQTLFWILQIPEVDQKSLQPYLERYLIKAIEYSPPGEIFQNFLKDAFNYAVEANLKAFTEYFIRLIIENFRLITLLDRFEVLEIITDTILKFDTEDFSSLEYIIEMKKFEISLEEDLSEQAERIFDTIFNKIKSKKVGQDDFIETVLIAISGSLKHGYGKFIEKSINEVIEYLEVVGERHVEYIIIKCLETIEANKATDIEYNGVNLYVYMFEQLLNLVELYEYRQLYDLFLPNFISFCYSKSLFNEYVNALTIFAKIKHKTKTKWMSRITQSLKLLANQNQIDHARLLINNLSELQLDEISKREFIEAQLLYNNTINSNLLTGEEVILLRRELILISQFEDNITKVVDNYKKGLQELIDEKAYKVALEIGIEALNYFSSKGLESEYVKMSEKVRTIITTHVDQKLTTTSVDELKEIYALISQMLNQGREVGFEHSVILLNHLSSKIIGMNLKNAYKFVMLLILIFKEIAANKPSEIDILVQQYLDLFSSNFNRLLRYRYGSKKSYDDVQLIFLVSIDFFININDEENLLKALDDVIAHLKKQSFREKKISHSSISAFYHFGTIYYKLNDNSSQHLKDQIVNKAIDFIEAILTLGNRRSEIYKNIEQILYSLRVTPDNTMYELLFQIDGLLEIV